MSGYMGGTVLYVDTSIKAVVCAAVSPILVGEEEENLKERRLAQNHTVFMMTHLLCQMESNLVDKYMAKNKEVSKRIEGSPSGLSCALFVRRGSNRSYWGGEKDIVFF